MISAKAIAARIETLCRDIQTEFEGTDKLVVVGLLRGILRVHRRSGARAGSADRGRFSGSLKSTVTGWRAAAKSAFSRTCAARLKGATCLVVEDIVDTGHTLHHVTKLLNSREPATAEDHRAAG